jgi:alpha-D-xyloside xylohydrolase
VSSKNYGILWDNNSRTKFGDMRDYQPISSLRLFNNEGNLGGLTAEYFQDVDFKKIFIRRTESALACEFLDSYGEFPERLRMESSSVRWSGEIASDLSGPHSFRLYSSGYIKLWVDGQLLADRWRQGWLPWTDFFTLPMRAGEKHKIVIEWIPNSGQSFISFRWLGPDGDAKDKLSLYSEVGDQIDYYFIFGENLDGVIRGYRDITGRTPMMPKWALGLWQSRERYRTQDELLSVVKEFRKRQIPLDNIVQDWFYWKEDKWGDHEFDHSRYPDPAGMIRELHEKLHARLMISVWPKFYVGTDHYKQFSEKGWLYTRNVEKGRRDWVGPGYVSTFYDAFNRDARKLYWKQINDELFRLGVDAWWLDSTEPDIYSNTSVQEKQLLMHPTALGTGARMFNAYSLVNCEAVYDGQRGASPNQRVFILTRSAFAGQQRYAAATWSGDVAARWTDLKAQIPAGLNFCLSGIPYWTTDIGGFAVERRFENAKGEDLEEFRELMTRWFQFGAFCPLLRVHGQFPYREMFNVAPDNHPAYQAMLSYDKLRYRLMPYVYSLAGRVTMDGYTIMRALVMDYGGDVNVRDIGDQYMFGPALLVNPVTEYKARSRSVYLPSGTGWYELKTGEFLEGGRTILADAPYGDIPVYVREGSILPFGPEIQYSDEKPADPIWLFVYTGKDASFELYEDENVNYNYEKGLYSIIPISYDEAKRTLTIGDRKGEFPGMLLKRTFLIRWIKKDKKSGLDFNAAPDATLTYEGKAQSIRMR